MRRTGVVMSVSGNVAIVLTRDGEFCEVPCTQNVFVGSEIEWDADAIKSKVKSSRNRSIASSWRKMVVSSAAAVVAIAGGIYYYGTQTAMAATPYAYVSVEINPDVSLVLNKKMHVISAAGLNNDGQELVRRLRLKGDSVRNAIHKIVDASVAEHMLPTYDNIVVASAPAQKNTDVRAVQIETQKDVQEAVGSNKNAKKLEPKVYSIQLSKTVWTVASGAKIAPGKLATLLIARKHHMSISPSDIQGQTTRLILDESHGDNEATTDDEKQVQNALRQSPPKATPALTVAQAFHPVGIVPPDNVVPGDLHKGITGKKDKSNRPSSQVTGEPSAPKDEYPEMSLAGVGSLIPSVNSHEPDDQNDAAKRGRGPKMEKPDQKDKHQESSAQDTKQRKQSEKTSKSKTSKSKADPATLGALPAVVGTLSGVGESNSLVPEAQTSTPSAGANSQNSDSVTEPMAHQKEQKHNGKQQKDKQQKDKQQNDQQANRKEQGNVPEGDSQAGHLAHGDRNTTTGQQDSSSGGLQGLLNNALNPSSHESDRSDASQDHGHRSHGAHPIVRW